LPAKMHVDADVGTGVSAKTVGELRKVTTWSENLVITTPQERHPESAVKISKASVATRNSPKQLAAVATRREGHRSPRTGREDLTTPLLRGQLSLLSASGVYFLICQRRFFQRIRREFPPKSSLRIIRLGACE